MNTQRQDVKEGLKNQKEKFHLLVILRILR